MYDLLRNEKEYKILHTSLPENACLVLADVSEDNVIFKIQNTVLDKSIDLLMNNAGMEERQVSYKTDIAQPNADLEPSESAKQIIGAWEEEILLK